MLGKKKVSIFIGCIAILVVGGILGVMFYWRQSGVPTKKQIIQRYEEAGYQVETMDTCGEVKDVTRIVATKDGYVADFVYSERNGVTEDVLDYYNTIYDNSYIIGNRCNNNHEFIYYANDAKAWKIADTRSIKVSVGEISIDK